MADLPEDALFLVDEHGRILTWSFDAKCLTGRGDDEALGRSITDLLESVSTTPGEVSDALLETRQKGTSVRHGTVAHPLGHGVQVRVQLTSLAGPDGGRFVCSMRPIPPADAPRRDESEERFRLLVDTVRDYAIFMLDPAGRIATWNRGAQAIKGYTAAEITHRHFSAFYTAEDIADGKPERELTIARAEGRVEDEGWRVRKDGSLFWAAVVITALYDDAGELRGFAKVTRDLSARHEMEEELRQSEERFRRLVDSVSDHAMYILDEAGVVRSWNAGAHKLKQYAADEIIGKHFSIFFQPEDAAAGKPARELSTALAHGEFREQAFRLRRDGTRFWADVRLTPLRDKHGKLLGFSKITHDLTQRLETEAANRAAEAAREANRLKDEFLAAVSHELRTPLNAIVGWSSLVRTQGADPVLQKAIEVIHRNALAQQRIVDDLLDVSRIVSGKLRLEIAPTNLVSVVREALEVVAPAATAKNIHVELDAPADDCTLSADSGRLHQVVWNLLSNALKFSAAGTTVQVVVRARVEELTLIVCDHGQGISPDFLPYVFDRFRQADGTTSRRVGGIGLGLSIVRELVELHGGRVQVDSPGEGRGASFTVHLPRAQSSRGAQAAVSAQPPLAGLRVLVVDDDPDARELLGAVLAAAGASVTEAQNASEGLAAVQSSLPHVLVSDIGMPVEDGYRFLQRVRALAPERGGNTPAIALTAYTSHADQQKAFAAGFARHVAKPYDPETLVGYVRALAPLA